MYVRVMGGAGSGKTTFINEASGTKFNVGAGLHACTTDIQVTPCFFVDGVPIKLIDTPG
jgi:hypothetical protein